MNGIELCSVYDLITSTYIIIDKSEIRQLLWIRISFDLHICLRLFLEIHIPIYEMNET